MRTLLNVRVFSLCMLVRVSAWGVRKKPHSMHCRLVTWPRWTVCTHVGNVRESASLAHGVCENKGSVCVSVCGRITYLALTVMSGLDPRTCDVPPLHNP